MPNRVAAAVSFVFQVGSRVESVSTSGLTHFIEHMVFKGSRRYPSAHAISAAIEAVGGDLNAETDKEATQFWTKVPAVHLDTALDVLADMLFYPRLDDEEVAKERTVVIEELRMYSDNPQDRVQTLFDEVMWPGHPLGWEVVGREETVATFTAADCAAYVARHYRPPSLIVTVAGDVDEGQVLAALEQRLHAGNTDGPPLEMGPPASDPSGPRLRAEERATEQTNVIVGTRWLPHLHPLRYAAELLNVILGEGMSSRLFTELREKEALVYDIHSYAIRLRDSGALGISFGCDPKRAPEAARRALRELQRLFTGDSIPAEELRRAKEFVKGHLMMQLDGSGGRASFYAHQEITGEVVSPQEWIARIESVSAEELREAGRLALASGIRGAVVGPDIKVSELEAVLGEVA